MMEPLEMMSIIRLGWVIVGPPLRIMASDIDWTGKCGACGKEIQHVNSSRFSPPKAGIGSSIGSRWEGYFHTNKGDEHFEPVGWRV